MQDDPRYDDVVADVAAFLEQRLAFAVAAGRPGGADLPRPRASASARPSSTTSSSCAGCDVLAALGRPVRRRLLAQELARPAARRPATRRPARRGQRRRRGRRLRARRDDPPRPRRPRARRGARRRARRCGMTIVELHGLEVFGHHGVLEDEQRDGQPFLYDVELEVARAGATDRIEDAVDYREVAAASARSPRRARYDLIEALAQRSPTRCSSASRRSAGARPGAEAAAAPAGRVVGGDGAARASRRCGSASSGAPGAQRRGERCSRRPAAGGVRPDASAAPPSRSRRARVAASPVRLRSGPQSASRTSRPARARARHRAAAAGRGAGRRPPGPRRRRAAPASSCARRVDRAARRRRRRRRRRPTRRMSSFGSCGSRIGAGSASAAGMSSRP